jgi:hypothetical protein
MNAFLCIGAGVQIMNFICTLFFQEILDLFLSLYEHLSARNILR